MFTKGSTAIDSIGRKTAALAVGGGEVTAEVSLAALEVPEDAAAEQQHQREHRQLGVVMRCWARSPWYPGEDERNGQADQKCDSCELLDLPRPIECATKVLEDLQQGPTLQPRTRRPTAQPWAAQPDCQVLWASRSAGVSVNRRPHSRPCAARGRRHGSTGQDGHPHPPRA